MHFWLFLCLVAQVLALACSVPSADICYVRPADSPLSSCPGQPCLTLHEYVEINNFTNGTTLQFLPGNHTLQQSFSLVNISYVTFEAAFNSSVANIIYKDSVTIHSSRVTHLNIIGLSFILSQGGDRSALEFNRCRLVFISNTVFKGSGAVTGRAMRLSYSEATISRCLFESLTVTGRNNGGAIHSTAGTHLTIHRSSFINNVAGYSGGAISAPKSSLLLNETHFYGNLADMNGGAIICSWNRQVDISQVDMVGNNTFHNNSCQHYGGAICFVGLNANATHLTLKENVAGRGGGAMYVRKSSATLHGNVTIASNTAETGGGIRADRSYIRVTGDCSLAWNNATFGGAMNTLYGTVSIQGPTQFTHNTADEDGGAMLADNTVIQFLNKVNFNFNSANNGGAMFLKSGASMNLSYLNPLITGPLFTSLFNTAHEDGGVIYHSDSPSDSQCIYSEWDSNESELPNCFMQFHHYDYRNPAIVSRNDSAEREGNFLFGGWMDRCRILHYFDSHSAVTNAISIYPGSQPTTKEISSKPYSLCLTYSTFEILCSSSSKVMQVEVYRGQKFTVPLQAKMQYGPSAAIVTAVTSSTARLETYQTSQVLPATDYNYRVFLSYTVYSTESHEQVVLYPDGPCRDTGFARVVIDVILLPCPDGFTQSGEICTCEDRLHDYPINCTIADTPYLAKTAGLSFWMDVWYVNTYQGLVLCKSCPAEYCKKGAVNVTLDNPDVQCDLNRTGLLCGACAANHSLMLGSSKCQVCPNTYLALLLPFAAAGVALVVFLTSLRLTVATGTLNSMILYANILQVKRSLFFPQNTINFLTVFLAWMNLDFGFQTCFYDGLDAYALTWLQFAFPLYVWLIIVLMIFISRCSITVSKLIGSNPVAVLATLLLMSYTKILKVIIGVYSYENLEYPDNKTVPVWFKDANVPYLESKHLLLTVVTSLVLVFLFLPYTLLTLLGHKLYCFTGKKHWRWLNRLKPLLDSYHAPYKNHTRYWTGFLLLVRCALYIVFSFSSANKSLLTIVLTFTVSGFIVGFLRIYESLIINLIEACVYLNLIVLSVTALIGLNTAALVYSLVGLVFVSMIALIAHQFHLLYVAKTALWLRLKRRFRKVPTEVQISDDTVNQSHDPHNIVTKSVIELREPLLDS